MPCGLFFSKYQDDEAVFQTTFVKSWMVVFFIFILTYPLYADSVNQFLGMDTIDLLIQIFIFLIGAHGLNLLTGYTGQISLGHGAFMGVGAYATGILASTYGLPLWLALPLGGLVTALVGMVFGLPSLRLKGLYLAIATLAAQYILVYGMRNWEGLTGGSSGLTMPTAELFGYEFDEDVKFYYLAFAFAVIATIYIKNITRTRPGRAFVAVRDRYLAAEVIGVNLFTYRIMSFAISSFMVGIAGGLWGYYSTIVSDEDFTIWLSVLYLAMIIVGGMGHVLGAVFGTVFMLVLPELLRIPCEMATELYPNVFSIFASLREMVFGVIVIWFLVFEPDGLAARWQTIKSYWKLWPFSY